MLFILYEDKILSEYKLIEILSPYGGLLCSSCGGQQPSAASKRPFELKDDISGRRDGRTTGLRELDMLMTTLFSFRLG